MERSVTPRHLTISLVAAAAIAAPLAGCGGSSNSNSTQTSAKSSTSTQATTTGGAGAVTIDNFKFMPPSLTVSSGTRISISNKDSTAHTVTADDAHTFDTGDVNPGSSTTITVSKPGTYQYHCNIHPFMHGTLVVK
jgi:plastocyanin